MPAANSDLSARLQALVKGPQFVWWLGHITLLFCSALYLPYWLTFSAKAGAHWYTRAFFGALISYSVVVYKSFPSVQFTAQFAQTVFTEENVQYLLMAIYWWRTTPFIAALIPYGIFAFFNAINYVRTSLIPTFYPPGPDGKLQGVGAETSRKIQVWTEKNHTKAMALVAYVEIVGVMGSLILGAITFQSSLLSPIVYANFLRFRYFFSLHHRAAFEVLRARLDNWIVPPGGNPKMHPQVVKAYEVARGAITRFGMAAVQPPSAAPPRG
ncbi:hypothetical protein BGW38_010411 [Lunasporangiospora selenospora]|uniref:Uncharacterized protein n=1 Tax=Lunasporangiospora selenospora TaxID=979761 RepID=A0A9P6KII8_9FUNG|nr:hypothetical protein BGW38_010411 [Lunasporangiospora selenospora]